MKPTKFTLSRIPIERGYVPGYPPRLTREEFEALLAPRNRDRVRALWGAACATLVLSAGGEDGSEREARVLGLLQREAEARPLGYSWLWAASMQQLNGPSRQTEHVYMPRIPISFGNSSMGLFDAGSARKLAGEIFRAYGLELETGVALETPAVHARLDGADRARKLGFKLRGLVTKHEMGASAEDEPEATDLSLSERAALEKDGWKLHVADASLYPLMDGDQLTPTLAYVCGVVEFLNSVTDGPDLDLRALLLGQRLCFAIPDLKALGLTGGSPQSGYPDGTLQEFELKEPRKLALRFNAPGSSAPVQRPRGRSVREKEPPTPPLPTSTAGRISALQLPVLLRGPYEPGGPMPGPVHVRLEQPRGEHAAPLVIECWSDLVFTPSSFDALQPFEIAIELQRGRYVLKDGLDVMLLRD